MGGEAILGSVERIFFLSANPHEERRTHSELPRPHLPELGSGLRSIWPLLGPLTCAVSPLASLSSGWHLTSAYGISVTSSWIHPGMEEPLPYTHGVEGCRVPHPFLLSWEKVPCHGFTLHVRTWVLHAFPSCSQQS